MPTWNRGISKKALIPGNTTLEETITVKRVFRGIHRRRMLAPHSKKQKAGAVAARKTGASP
jgi:hypothetical protein